MTPSELRKGGTRGRDPGVGLTTVLKNWLPRPILLLEGALGACQGREGRAALKQ